LGSSDVLLSEDDAPKNRKFKLSGQQASAVEPITCNSPTPRVENGEMRRVHSIGIWASLQRSDPRFYKEGDLLRRCYLLPFSSHARFAHFEQPLFDPQIIHEPTS
jgi:hypothetical protein